MDSTDLIYIENLKKAFPSKDVRGNKTLVRAVDDVTLSIKRGECLGLVGESGSGKTTLGRTILRLVEPDSGKIYFDGTDITGINMKPYRSKMQIIFQNPSGSLDPRMRVFNIISEGIKATRRGMTKSEMSAAVFKLLDAVGLNSTDAYRYPHEFSGGQQQRIGIARALAVNPEFIVCDEPVSALDVSYQSQIINLLEDLQERLGFTYLFISHDLSVVMHISDRIGVMYLGKIVELGSCEDIFLRPAHPYTKALLSAIPVPDPKISRQREHKVTSFDDTPAGIKNGGCSYCALCSYATAECAKAAPKNREIATGHFCACHLA